MVRKLFIAATLVLIAAVALLAPRMLDAVKGESRPPARAKQFRRMVAEGVRVDHPDAAADVLRCGSCRIEKLRKGPLTFGGINVLVLEDLRVTLSDSFAPAERGPSEGEGRVSAREVLGAFGNVDGFLELHGLPATFSEIRVERLEVLRLEGTNAVPFFKAESAAACSDGLEMTDFVLSEEDGFRPCRAILRIKPHLRLEWRGGSRDLFQAGERVRPPGGGQPAP